MKIYDFDLKTIQKGFFENEEQYHCVVCEKNFKKGNIFNIGDQMYDAYGAILEHIKNEHYGMLAYILRLGHDQLGIPESMFEILKLMALGKTDKEIQDELGIAASTIRNQRFKLREKEKQAKLLLACLGMLDVGVSKIDEDSLIDPHMQAKMIDDRYNITESEEKSIIKTYFDENGALISFPSKEKRKIIVLRHIVKSFKLEHVYSEKEVNVILKRIFDDYVSIRRALIEYGFMERSRDCSSYQIKK